MALPRFGKTKSALLIGSLLMILLLCGGSISLLMTTANVSPYPTSQQRLNSKPFPQWASNWSSAQWTVEHIRFYATADSRQRVAFWHQKEGWQSANEAGQRWILTSRAESLKVHHSAILYTDYWQEVCPYEQTCIFLKSTYSIPLPFEKGVAFLKR